MGNGQGKPVDLTGESTCKTPERIIAYSIPPSFFPPPTCLARGAATRAAFLSFSKLT